MDQMWRSGIGVLFPLCVVAEMQAVVVYAGLKMLCAAMQCHVVVGGGQRRVTRDSGGPRFCSFGRPYLL